jgi:hypothetical protein
MCPSRAAWVFVCLVRFTARVRAVGVRLRTWVRDARTRASRARWVFAARAFRTRATRGLFTAAARFAFFAFRAARTFFTRAA